MFQLGFGKIVLLVALEIFRNVMAFGISLTHGFHIFLLEYGDGYNAISDSIPAMLLFTQWV